MDPRSRDSPRSDHVVQPVRFVQGSTFSSSTGCCSAQALYFAHVRSYSYLDETIGLALHGSLASGVMIMDQGTPRASFGPGS